MGNPQHYSKQLPSRCADLIQLLYPIVAAERLQSEKYSGPLTTTLVLSLATPMIILPIERIQKAINGHASHVDESHVDQILTDRIATEFKKKLCETRFFDGLDWSFVGGWKKFNLAEGISSELATRLSTTKANGDAAAMPVAQFAGCLRNALAHGGIMYLDERGNSSDGAARMLAFIGGKTGKHRPMCEPANEECRHAMPPIESLNILRISEPGFREFLSRWASWLSDSGTEEALGAFATAT